ncbi:MAG: DUF2384 domain-containing protein [Burkholderiales bacterium]|nr:MAG: DUF2384 domain-containing protein [Burkholderiales bacterium]
MTSNRERRAKVQRMQRRVNYRRREGSLEDALWDRIAPVGREFGSPDFERLMEEDRRNRVGVFDPAMRQPIADQADRDVLVEFFKIARRWELTREEQAVLLGIDGAYVECLEGPLNLAALSDETRARLRDVMKISDALQVLLPIPERADAWVRQPNAAPMFGGATALSYMLRGRLSDLHDVACYLVAHCSGDFS